MNDLGKSLIVVGVLIVVVGAVLMLAGRVPWLGRMPGDIYFQRGNWSFYFPVVTSLVVSVLLTLLFWLFGRR
jgi:membrane protein implicated in regulation of membrane protease activity